MVHIQNSISDHASIKKEGYIIIAIFILFFSSFYKLYQPIKYLGIPETDTWGFVIISDFIAQNHYTSEFANGVYATHNAILQLILNIPQEYIGIFGGQITFLVPLFFFIIARRCGKNKIAHLLALLIGGFWGLNRTVLYAPETFSYIFILLFIYLSGIFYLLNRKIATSILLFYLSWVYISIHQTGIGAYFALGGFTIINGVIYRKQILHYFRDLINRPKFFILFVLLFSITLVSLFALNIFDPLIGQLKFYLTNIGKIVDPIAYLYSTAPPFSELFRNFPFILLTSCLTIIFILKKYKDPTNIQSFFFYSSISFFIFYFGIIYILPRIGIEVPSIGRFYTWFQLSIWISFIIVLSIVINQFNKKILVIFTAITIISVIPPSPEINVQFSGTIDTLNSVKTIYSQDLIKPNSILYTQWYYAPSLSFGFSGYSGYVNKGIEIVQIPDWGWPTGDMEKTFSQYFALETKKRNKKNNFKHSYLILSKYLLQFSKTEKASLWTKAMSNGNLSTDQLSSFRFLENIIYEDEYNILFKLPE